jgi:DNA-binding GntR family transcriptional regulator
VSTVSTVNPLSTATVTAVSNEVIAGDGPVATAVTAGAASARVASYLRTAILDGDIAPGEWIRQEEVADRFGASRLPVREALRILEAEGLTEHEPNKGARVPKLDAHEVDVVYQMRERLEPLAITESIPHLVEAHLYRLEELQQQIEANTDVAVFLELDREFHLLTYTGCAIDQLTNMVTRLWNSTQHYRRAFVSLSGPERRWVVNAEHRLLLDAVQRRDTVDAERYLTGHIRRTRIELGRHPEVFEGGA